MLIISHTVFAGVRKHEDGEALLREPRAAALLVAKKGALIPVLLDVSSDESVSKAVAQVLTSYFHSCNNKSYLFIDVRSVLILLWRLTGFSR